MAKKTIYVRDEDVPLWEYAKRHTSRWQPLSEMVTVALRRHLDWEDKDMFYLVLDPETGETMRDSGPEGRVSCRLFDNERRLEAVREFDGTSRFRDVREIGSWELYEWLEGLEDEGITHIYFDNKTPETLRGDGRDPGAPGNYNSGLSYTWIELANRMFEERNIF
jgi:hypothetical protein